MPTVFLAPAPILNTQFIPGGNVPASGGQLFAYISGSSTKLNTYTTSSGAVANANPYVLDSGGNLTGSREIWLIQSSTYRFVLAPSNDTDPPSSPYWTMDSISGVNDVPNQTGLEWIISSTAPVFAASSSFALPGDQTATFTLGRRVKTTNTGGTIYGTVTSSAFTTSTAVGIATDSGALDSGLSAVSYGLLSTPNGSIPWTAIRATGLDFSQASVTTTGTLVVTSSATFNSTVSISKAATFASTATVNNLLTASSLSVNSTATFGNLIDISSSTAGQIKFSSTQNVSADPNTIDAYQEGSVTVPGLTLSFNTSSTGWAFNAAGRYVKIGKFVYLGYSITVTKGSATGSCLLEGLPFTADTTLSGGGAVNNWVSMSTAFAHISADVVASTTTAKLYGSSSGVASLVQLTDTAFQTSSQIIGTLCYRAIA